MFLFQYLDRCVEAEAKWLSFALKKVREKCIQNRDVFQDVLNHFNKCSCLVRIHSEI